MPMPFGPIQVNSNLFQRVFFDAQRCRCGGRLRDREEHVVRRREATIRQVYATCRKCRRPVLFEFDVSLLARRGDDARRFLGTVTRYLDGLSAFKRSDFDTAEARLLAALDPRTGEPNLSAAHYYLGRVAASTGRPEEAVQRFRRAALLQPMELAYHEALLAAYRAAGQLDAALAELAELEDVRLRLGG
ncbi:MAG: tetratricopeptide repeat protein [Planctomycetes bacterium]|nr:tetratricopeptide repeat protein [Planctomycetota bacterium]